MRELLTLWRNTRMVVLVAQIAALYAAVIIPFKIATIIPGITEVRPATAIPVVCGILFGPAAAWGSAFGNLIADFFGSLGPGSLFGFIANFLYGYIPYRVWRLLSKGEEEFAARGPGPRLLAFILLGSTVAATLVYAVTLAKPDPTQNPLLPHACKITLGMLLVLNGYLVWVAGRSKHPQSLGEVMDPNTGETPSLALWAWIGVVICAILTLVFWTGVHLGGVLRSDATFALCELAVLLNAAVLAWPVWSAVSQRPGSRLATSSLARFGLTTLVASLVCAFVVAFGVDLFRVAPFGVVGPIVFVNNFVLTLLLGPVLLGILYPRMARWGLLLNDVLPAESRGEGYAPAAGLAIVAITSLAGLVVGCWMAFAPGQAVEGLALVGFDISPDTAVSSLTWPFLGSLLVGAALL